MKKEMWLTKQQRAQRLARQYGLTFGCPCGREAGGVAPDGAICPDCARALYQLTTDAHRLLTQSSGIPYRGWDRVYSQHTTES